MSVTGQLPFGENTPAGALVQRLRAPPGTPHPSGSRDAREGLGWIVFTKIGVLDAHAMSLA
jgi:hypothetical protein